MALADVELIYQRLQFYMVAETALWDAYVDLYYKALFHGEDFKG